MTRLKLRHVHAFVDRHGRVRHYFRRRGAKQVPLPGLPGSAEFMAAYQAALAGVTAPAVEIGANRYKPGTVDAAVVGYYQSLTFRELAPSTQRMRRQIIERFRVEHGAKQISTLPTRFLVLMLSRMKPAAARNCRGSDFSDEFRKWCDAAALPKSSTAHGLRKTAACRLVNDGATTHQIAAMTGHASLSEVQRYTKAADQARLAREAVALRQRRAEQTKSESEVANLSRRFANGSKKL